MGVIKKTTIKTVYSVNGKSFWLEYSDSKSMLNVVGYALKDLERGQIPFDIRVSELDLELYFKVPDEETKAACYEFLKEAIKDLS